MLRKAVHQVARLGAGHLKEWAQWIRVQVLRSRSSTGVEDGGFELDLRRPECRTVYAVIYRQTHLRR